MLAHAESSLAYSADASHKVSFFRKQTLTCLRPLQTLGSKKDLKKTQYCWLSRNGIYCDWIL